MIHGPKLIREDRLVAVFRTEGERYGETFFQGKRVGKDCPLTEAERRTYVRHGAAAAVGFIKRTRGLSLRAALDLLNKARYHS